MASAKPRIHCRRCLRGPALFLALWAVLLCSAPAPAADQTNPAGNTITKNPGMAATADGDRLTNNGTIKATTTGGDPAVGMGDPTRVTSSFTSLTLTNSGSIEANATSDTHAIGMRGGDYSTLTNSGTITARATTYEAYGMYSGAGSTLANSGAITANATGTGRAYGMSGGAGSTLTNSGAITASATGGPYAYGMYGGAGSSLANYGSVTATGRNYAYGMYAGAGAKLSNSGAIAASATATARTYAYGMQGGTNSSLINSGAITASAAATSGEAYGMHANGANSSLINSGTITASATGDWGDAYGMYAGGDNGSLANSGAIAATATTGQAYGMVANGSNSTLVNSGTVTASGVNGAYGMDGGDNSTLTNSGAITASATGNWGEVYGMYSGSNSVLANSGTITASATGDNGRAYGMCGPHSSLTNSGTITASATGDNGTAWGMYTGGDYSILTNTGTVTASTTGDNGRAYGMEGFAYNVTLTNNRIITAIAATATGKAYGMALYSGTVANTGLVSAVAANPSNAWEVYGTSDNSAGTVSITEWATDLRDFTTYKFFGSDGAKLDLTGSRLTLRPGAPERGFAWGREYAVASMIDGNHGLGAVASVTQEVPWVRASLTGTDWRDQKLSLHPNFTRKTNPGQLAASQGIAVVLDQARAMGSVIDQQFRSGGAAPAAVADSGPAAFPTASAPDSGWSGFLTPYFSYVDNSDLDYDAKIAGFMAGATRRFSDAFAAGVHLGFSHADVSADLADQDGEALTGLFGLHAIYNATPEWYLRGQLTGFLSRASNDWESGLPVYPLYTDADINSRGLYASLATGYDWRINASNTITPEIGLSWLWSHQDSFSLDWKDRFGNRMDNYDLDYKAQDYNALYGTAMVRWRGEFALAGGSFQPALGVGVRQTLTDGDVKSRLATAGSSFSTKATEDETSALAEAGFVWQRGITSVGLTYTGGYGDDQVVHTGWLTLKLEF